MSAWQPSVRYTPGRNDRPETFNKYLALKLHTSVLKAVPLLVSASGVNPNANEQGSVSAKVRKTGREDTFQKARFSFSEKITWLEPRMGYIPPTEKEVQDDLAIGGLHNAPNAVARLHTVTTFGRKLGDMLLDLTMNNERQHMETDTLHESWISVTCSSIGSNDDGAGPPADAITAVKSMLIEMTGMVPEDTPAPRKTDVDACLLEAWRVA